LDVIPIKKAKQDKIVVLDLSKPETKLETNTKKSKEKLQKKKKNVFGGSCKKARSLLDIIDST